MNLSAEQLEWIVSEVVRRLRGEPDTLPTRCRDELALTERLVTTETLRGRLDRVTSVSVSAGAVVTPAAVDLLKDREIQLIRGASPHGS